MTKAFSPDPHRTETLQRQSPEGEAGVQRLPNWGTWSQLPAQGDPSLDSRPGTLLPDRVRPLCPVGCQKWPFLSTQEGKEQTNPTLSPKQLQAPAAQFHTGSEATAASSSPRVSPDPQHSHRDGDTPRDTPRHTEGVKGSHQHASTTLPPWGQPESPLPKNNHSLRAYCPGS